MEKVGVVHGAHRRLEKQVHDQLPAELRGVVERRPAEDGVRVAGRAARRAAQHGPQRLDVVLDARRVQRAVHEALPGPEAVPAADVSIWLRQSEG